MALAQIQDAFATALLDPARPVPDSVGGQRNAARFAVYRNNIAVGLAKALAARFPVTARLVGEDFFRGMARAYMGEARPASPLMFAYGDDFPDFIAGFAPAAELPYLADVARLEALRTRAYHAAEAPPLTVADLAGLVAEEGAEAFSKTLLACHPAAALLTSAYPVGSIWQAHQQAEIEAEVAWQPETVLVTRPDALVLIHVLPADAAAFASALLAGQTLGEAAAAGIAVHPAFDFGAALTGLAGLGTFRCLERNRP